MAKRIRVLVCPLEATSVNDATYTAETVVKLIERLVDELMDGAKEWENTSAESYLDALGGWLGDRAGYYRNNFGIDVPDNPWRILYDALEAARTYE
jgi:hypothetical protein